MACYRGFGHGGSDAKSKWNGLSIIYSEIWSTLLRMSSSCLDGTLKALDFNARNNFERFLPTTMTAASSATPPLAKYLASTGEIQIALASRWTIEFASLQIKERAINPSKNSPSSSRNLRRMRYPKKIWISCGRASFTVRSLVLLLKWVLKVFVRFLDVR